MSTNNTLQIIRYSNRIEIRNVGHSLKPAAELGLPGSKLRNPTIAAVLHDLHLAEAKGTGIRTMRRLAAEAGLTLPEFHSSRESDDFRATLFLHNLLTEDDHVWLRSLTPEALNNEEAKILIYARETGTVDNAACRDFSGLDTLTASNVLRRLRDRGLLEKQGSGKRTYYTLSIPAGRHPDSLPEEVKTPKRTEACNLELATLPPELATLLASLKGRVTPEALRDGICRLCAWSPLTCDQLASLLGKDRHYLRNKHLTPMVRVGLLKFRYPETAKHPHQAYLASSE